MFDFRYTCRQIAAETALVPFRHIIFSFEEVAPLEIFALGLTPAQRCSIMDIFIPCDIARFYTWKLVQMTVGNLLGNTTILRDDLRSAAIRDIFPNLLTATCKWTNLNRPDNEYFLRWPDAEIYVGLGELQDEALEIRLLELFSTPDSSTAAVHIVTPGTRRRRKSLEEKDRR
jgi:hypothetical protein